MSTTLESIDLVIGHSLCQTRELFVLSKEVVAVEAAIFGGKSLHLAVYRICKGTGQRTCHISCEEAIPVASPH